MTRLFPSTIVICTFLHEPACIQREKLHTVKMEAPNRLSPSWGTSWGMGETKWRGTAKTIFLNLQEHLLLIYGRMHQACYSSRGAAEGGKLKGKNQIHHNPPGQSWGCCNVHDWIKHVCLQVFISVTNMELSSSRIVAIHKRDPWCFHVYRCSQHSQKLDHLLWYHTGKLMEVVRVFRKEDTVAVLRIRLDQN